MGNPDLPAPRYVIEKLVETAGTHAPIVIQPPRASPASAALKPAITLAASA